MTIVLSSTSNNVCAKDNEENDVELEIEPSVQLLGLENNSVSAQAGEIMQDIINALFADDTGVVGLGAGVGVFFIVRSYRKKEKSNKLIK